MTHPCDSAAANLGAGTAGATVAFSPITSVNDGDVDGDDVPLLDPDDDDSPEGIPFSRSRTASEKRRRPKRQSTLLAFMASRRKKSMTQCVLLLLLLLLLLPARAHCCARPP